jgi:predicted nuclease of predicted toxin-antitoxin system
MPYSDLRILPDQNIPVAVVEWLRDKHPQWKIDHVKELGFSGKPDEFLYKWAQKHKAIVLTYDEDFADARMYPFGTHHGVIRLRVWPTTTEKTKEALQRLIKAIPSNEWPKSLLIIDNNKIRHRKI